MLLQVVPRAWPPGAVHDTVHAVVRGLEYQRSVQSTILGRLMRWALELIGRLMNALHGSGLGRPLALGLAAAIVLLVVARMVLSAVARDETVRVRRGRAAVATDDPWLAAERLAAAGRFENAAHALYRGVITSLSQTERVRIDPAKTSGDYARELRARGSSAHAAFRAFARRFDVAVYGHGVCDAALVDDLRRLASVFAPRARAA